MNGNFESAGEWTLPKRGGVGGSKPEYPEKTPNNLSENRYHIIY